jgi:hypothetical protein
MNMKKILLVSLLLFTMVSLLLAADQLEKEKCYVIGSDAIFDLEGIQNNNTSTYQKITHHLIHNYCPKKDTDGNGEFIATGKASFCPIGESHLTYYEHKCSKCDRIIWLQQKYPK